MSSLPAAHRWRSFALGALLCLFFSAGPALAQPARAYPGHASREAVRAEKLKKRAERQALRFEEEERARAYRRNHPWAIGVIANPDAFLLGMGRNYVASFLGAGLGMRVKRELPNVSLRVSMLARAARGSIDSWNISVPRPAHSEQTVWGAELQGELAYRTRVFYVGPTFSAGYLHLQREALDERDFPSEDPPSDPIVLKVPGHASFAALGIALGGELMETGRVSAAVRVMGGPWNDMRHVYLQLSFLVSVLCWDGGGGA
jgi:hypothetical protein